MAGGGSTRISESVQQREEFTDAQRKLMMLSDATQGIYITGIRVSC